MEAKKHKACIVLRGIKRKEKTVKIHKKVRKLLNKWAYHDLIQKITI